MIRFAALGLAAAAALLGVGGWMLAQSISEYIDSPSPLNSAVGLVVFKVDGELVQYGPFAPGPELLLLAAGIVGLVASLVLAAITWKRRAARVY
jgi:hypothetical protein